ncbi:MAG: NADH:flavin oxidoreductase [Oscillospiraceae bacterium]|nr:NADH:flavin oxidoreductase [Oscillospiraceae bacterium]
MASLFSPAAIGGKTAPNRVVMAPTVKFCLHDGSGYVTEPLVEHYRLRAQSGTGIIIVEATAPTIGGKVHEKCLGLWEDGQIAGLAAVAAAIHAEGSLALLQLCYTGVSSKDPSADETSASSEYYRRGTKLCLSHALTAEEIRALQRAHVDAALRAAKAGFDGVEIHCSHEKLLGRFFDAVTNHRTDQYGGSFENRARIFTELLSQLRAALPQGFLVGLRMGVNLPDLEQARGIARVIDAAGVDYFHFSKHILPASGDVPEGFPCHPTVYHGTLLRKEVHAPVMVSFGITDPAQAAYLMETDAADFVSLGRPMLADWDWTGKAKRGEAVNRCRHCANCQWRVDAALCPASHP